ncbi:MAG: VanW family protein [Clostridia bacterium]|nr:VanW family protein [Clostridia bacterium]
MFNKKTNMDNEKVTVYVMTAVIVVIIGIIAYTIFSSNNSLYNNKVAVNESANIPKSNNQTNNNSGNTGSITQEEKDNMNVNIPPVTTTQETEIATYTTTIYDKDANRVHNISLAISKLNNTIIKSNQEFSFNGLIGAMDASNGYKEAIGFDSNGNKIKMYGGGICQISSTLYNTALMTNLQVTERHPHSRRVYYVPVDKDATVFYGHRDLKFINNSGSDLKVLASNDDNNVTVKLIKLTTSSSAI